jgi:hypothetical protein
MLWFANALICVGLWTLGYKWRHSFLFSIAGELIYTVQSARAGQIELASICAVFCFLAFRNWLKWGKDATV